MKKERVIDIIRSWKNTEGNVHTTDELLQWIKELNETTHVSVERASVYDSDFWFYDDYNGEILNRKRSFFSVKGMRLFVNDHFVKEQPMIFQPEIGYLGIIVRKIDGVLNFLMQAKVEPGNVNCVQISPTIQATKSNFTRAHGGKLPAYFEMFEHSERYEILYDQVQSEQASRFLKKRNRNIMIVVDDEFEILPNFRWMTLGQIKELMKVDNLVNMDARTVLSGISFVTGQISDPEKEEIASEMSANLPLYHSAFETDISETLQPVLHYLNDYKMFQEVHKTDIPLFELIDWTVDEYGVRCEKGYPFEVAYFDIEISGREVRHWTQPLFVASGQAVFVLYAKEENGNLQFLVRACPEIGSFDKIECGPTLQLEATEHPDLRNPVELLYERISAKKEPVETLVDVVLSEEGGRFYHEQNRNMIIKIAPDALPTLPEGYFWMDYSALNFLIQSYNYANIQLRNLLSLLPLS